MKYRVHCYCVVRVPVEVEAESQEAAIVAARSQIDENSFRRPEAEDAEEITAFLVDEDGDEEFENTRTYDANGKLELPRAPAPKITNATPVTLHFGDRLDMKWTGLFGEFVSANGMSQDEIEEVAASLASKGEHSFGGGAAAHFILTLAKPKA